MRYFKLNSLVLYAVCPLKHKYSQTSKLQPKDCSEQQVIASALRDTYIHFFQMVGLKKEHRISYYIAYFSKRLVAYKKELNDESIFVSDAKSLIAAHDLVLKMPTHLEDTDELVAVNFPLERTLRGITIQDEVDLIFLRHPPNKESYVEMIYLDTSNRLPDEKDFGFLLKANYGYSVVLRELISSSIQVRCTVLNVLTNKRIEISFKEEQRFNYQRLISNLAKGIENEIFYPRPSFGACETCTFKQTCSWRIS